MLTMSLAIEPNPWKSAGCRARYSADGTTTMRKLCSGVQERHSRVGATRVPHAAFGNEAAGYVVQSRSNAQFAGHGTGRRALACAGHPAGLAGARQIVSDMDNGNISATHPKSAPIKTVAVNGKPWTELTRTREPSP